MHREPRAQSQSYCLEVITATFVVYVLHTFCCVWVCLCIDLKIGLWGTFGLAFCFLKLESVMMSFPNP